MKRYGLIGYPLGHSFSSAYFADKFAREGIEAVYENYPIQSICQLRDLVEAHPDLEGLNVTIPYKVEVIRYLDALSAEAEAIQAVNVIKILRTPNTIRLIGYNTDAAGFMQSILLHLQPHDQKALVLGTGGVAKAMTYVLQRLGLQVQCVSRHPKAGRSIGYDALTRQTMTEHTVIVNATPLGMYPRVGQAPQIPYPYITAEHLLFDAVYNPVMTKFLELGGRQGARCVNGLDMLHKQAIEAWKIWNDETT